MTNPHDPLAPTASTPACDRAESFAARGAGATAAGDAELGTGALLLRHRAWLHRLASALVRDDAADDVVQETLRVAMERPPHGALRTWLHRVATAKTIEDLLGKTS